jgi:hypothetical protein
MRFYLLAVTACLAVIFSVPSQASPWAEVGDNQLRSDIELLNAAGLIDGITIHWPIPWRPIVHALRGKSLAGEPPAVQAAARRVLEKAGAGTAAGFRSAAYMDATNQYSVVYGFDGMGRGDGQAQYSLNGNMGAVSGRLSIGDLTQGFSGKNTKLMLDGSYISATLWDMRLYTGYLDHWWGPGEISALQLSNNARPMPQVGISRATTEASSWPIMRWLGPWQWEFFLGYFDGPVKQPDVDYNAMRLTINPAPGLEIAVARTEEFCGKGHPCSPIKDYFHFANNPLNVDNVNDEAAWELKYTHSVWGVPLQAYVQLMNEDYSWFNHSGTSHLLGMSGFLPTGVNPLKLTLEFADTIATHHPFSFGDYIYGFTYTNGQYPDGMHYRDRTLGFSLDDDSRLIAVQASWSDRGNRFYELGYYHGDIGSSHSEGANIISPIPVLVNMGEARLTLPLAGFKIDLAGRVQDDQPRPNRGFLASIEMALRTAI